MKRDGAFFMAMGAEAFWNGVKIWPANLTTEQIAWWLIGFKDAKVTAKNMMRVNAKPEL